MLLCKISENVFKRQYRVQFLAAACSTLIMFAFGYSLGWFPIMLRKLESPTETALPFVLTLNDGSWMAGLTFVGAGCGNIVFGSLADPIGRKACLYIVAVPFIVSWILVFIASSIECLFASRFVIGFAHGGASVTIPLFIAEISDPNIRGRLASLFTLASYVGVIFGYIATPRLEYHILAIIAVTLAVIYLLLLIIFPETPMFLLQCGLESRAMDSLKFYRSYQPHKFDSFDEFKAEFDNMKAAVAAHKKNTESVTWRDFCNKTAAKALGKGFVLMLINIFCGAFAILYYTPSIFEAAHTAKNADSNTLIVGCVQVTGMFTATILVDVFGRKPLMIFSCIANCVGMTIFGIYGFLLEYTSIDMSAFTSWLPLVNVCFIMFAVNVGVMSIPFVLMVELMPANIRAKATAICWVMYNILGFILLKEFPISFAALGLAESMWFFAIVCLLGSIFVWFCIKETKGMSINEKE